MIKEKLMRLIDAYRSYRFFLKKAVVREPSSILNDTRRRIRVEIDAVAITIEVLCDIVAEMQKEKKNKTENVRTNKNTFFSRTKNTLEKIAPKTWKSQQCAFGDILEAHYDEVEYWEKKNRKFVAYLITGWELLQFSIYFFYKALSQAKEVNKEKKRID